MWKFIERWILIPYLIRSHWGWKVSYISKNLPNMTFFKIISYLRQTNFQYVKDTNEFWKFHMHIWSRYFMKNHTKRYYDTALPKNIIQTVHIIFRKWRNLCIYHIFFTTPPNLTSYMTVFVSLSLNPTFTHPLHCLPSPVYPTEYSF